MGYFNLNLTTKTSRLTNILTAIDVGSAPVMAFYTGSPPASPDDVPAGTLLATLPCSSPFGVISNGVNTPDVTAAGTGYTSIPTFALVSATGGTGAQFQVVMQLATMAIAAGGAGFAINDLLVLPAPSSTCLQSVVLLVTAVDGFGAITAASVQQAGQFITLPGSPVSEFETTGLGHSAAITFSTYSVAAVNSVAPGQGYSSAGNSGTALFTGGGGSGAAASPRLTPVLTASAITTVNASTGGTVGLARIANSSDAGIVDLDVGVAGSGASVIISSTLVVTGGPVVVTSAYIAEA